MAGWRRPLADKSEKTDRRLYACCSAPKIDPGFALNVDPSNGQQGHEIISIRWVNYSTQNIASSGSIEHAYQQPVTPNSTLSMSGEAFRVTLSQDLLSPVLSPEQEIDDATQLRRDGAPVAVYRKFHE